MTETNTKVKPPATGKIKDIGPIKYVEFPYLPGGGVVQFVGTSGKGKSTALVAIDALATGDGKLTKRDGAMGDDQGQWKLAIRQQAIDNEVCVYTALATDGELAATIFEGAAT